MGFAASAPFDGAMKGHTRRTAMRKIIVHINSTFNGVVTGDPQEDKTNFMVWTTAESVDSGSRCLLKTMETVDTILLGRNTYENLSQVWPYVADWPRKLP
jgi:hypothetical protein